MAALTGEIRGGVDGVRDVVALKGLGTLWHRVGWGDGDVDGVYRFRIFKLICDDGVRDELCRSIRRLLSHGNSNH